LLDRAYTIGVYGFTPMRFVERLKEARVDLLCDIRARRGVRGAAYAFANAKRLEQLMADSGIAYLHERSLAPTPSLRAAQQRADAVEGMRKRDRRRLSPSFVDGYAELLASSDAVEALERIAAHAVRPALLCVEQHPDACHRSLAAPALGVDVVHLTP
jgi:uncharacterized protein (DUF488 family)